MAITLPQQGDVQFPEVPRAIERESKELYEYLKKTQRIMQYAVQGMFNNSFTVATAINSGTSGTFAISSGGSIIVSSGIVIRVTS